MTSTYLNSPDNQSSIEIAKALYRSILDAGLQFQCASIDSLSRRMLRDLAQEVAPLMVEVTNESQELSPAEVISRLASLSGAFDEIRKQVPNYQNVAHLEVTDKRSIAKQKIIDANYIASLEDTCKVKREALKGAVNQLRFVSKLDKATTPNKKVLEALARRDYETAKDALSVLDKKIHTIIFFGDDLE